MRFAKKLVAMSFGLLLLVNLAGCTSSDNDNGSDWTPATGNITGEWVITAYSTTDGLVANGLPWSLAQTGTTFTIASCPGTPNEYIFPGIGILSGSSFTYTETETDPDPVTGYTYTFTITATVYSDNSISGTWADSYQDAGQPADTSSGTITMVRAAPPSFNLTGDWTFEYGTSTDYPFPISQGISAIVVDTYDGATSTGIWMVGNVQSNIISGSLEIGSDDIYLTGTITDANTMSGTWVDATNSANTGTWTATKP